MPTMSRVQAAFCRSRPWRALSGNALLPWSLQEFEPHGDVLEIGAGSGAMAAELLARYDEPTMTVTDFDQEMVDAASARLAAFGDRVLPPGGHVVGYDLLSTAPLRLLHHGNGARLRMMRIRELRAIVRDLPVDQAILTPGLAGLVVRFLLRKRSTAL